MSNTSTSVQLGGSASGITVYKMGYGTMMMTWTPEPTPDEKAFEAIKTAIECVPAGQKLFLNGGEFYGLDPRTANLELLARFFTKYPEFTNRVFLSVKGGITEQLKPDGSLEFITKSVDTCNEALDGKKKIDLFECARVDPNHTIEQIIENMKQVRDSGKFDHIGLSEVSAATLKKACAVPNSGVAAVEIEVSPSAYEEETKKVIATAEELKVTVIAYSPLGRGFLTGQLNKEDLPEKDFRRHLVKFGGDPAEHNKKIVERLTVIAEKKNVTTAQLCLAWVFSHGNHIVPIPGSSKVHRIEENFGTANVKITEDEMTEMNELVSQFIGPKGRGAGEEYHWA